MVKVTVEGNAVLLPVKVVPGASHTRLIGEWNGRAKIAVAAPPEKGRANEALARLLARRLKVHRREVTVVAGRTSPLKTVRIEGVTSAAILAALQPDRP